MISINTYRKSCISKLSSAFKYLNKRLVSIMIIIYNDTRHQAPSFKQVIQHLSKLFHSQTKLYSCIKTPKSRIIKQFNSVQATFIVSNNTQVRNDSYTKLFQIIFITSSAVTENSHKPMVGQWPLLRKLVICF